MNSLHSNSYLLHSEFSTIEIGRWLKNSTRGPSTALRTGFETTPAALEPPQPERYGVDLIDFFPFVPEEAAREYGRLEGPSRSLSTAS
jgi:hypothetical protein